MIFASEQTLQIKQYEGGGEHGGVNPYLTQRKTPWKKVVEADFFYHNGEFLCKKTRIVPPSLCNFQRRPFASFDCNMAACGCVGYNSGS